MAEEKKYRLLSRHSLLVVNRSLTYASYEDYHVVERKKVENEGEHTLQV